MAYSTASSTYGQSRSNSSPSSSSSSFLSLGSSTSSSLSPSHTQPSPQRSQLSPLGLQQSTLTVSSQKKVFTKLKSQLRRLSRRPGVIPTYLVSDGRVSVINYPCDTDGYPVEATRSALVSFYKAYPVQHPCCFHGIECRIINVASGINAGKTAAVCGLPMGEDDCTYWCNFNDKRPIILDSESSDDIESSEASDAVINETTCKSALQSSNCSVRKRQVCRLSPIRDGGPEFLIETSVVQKASERKASNMKSGSYSLPFPDHATGGYPIAFHTWEPPAENTILTQTEEVQNPPEGWFDRIVNVVSVQGINRNDFWTAWGYCNKCDRVIVGSVYNQHIQTNCGNSLL